MVDFEHDTDANGSGATALKEHINAIAASIPAAAPGAMPELGAPDASAAASSATAAGVRSAPTTQTAEAEGASRFGIWDLDRATW